MADNPTYYAWSLIRGGDNDNPIVVQAGEEVTRNKLGLDKDGWTQLVESGAVRTLKFPDMPDSYQDSPRNFLLEQAKKAEDMSGLDVAMQLGDLEEVPTAENGGEGNTETSSK